MQSRTPFSVRTAEELRRQAQEYREAAERANSSDAELLRRLAERYEEMARLKDGGAICRQVSDRLQSGSRRARRRQPQYKSLSDYRPAQFRAYVFPVIPGKSQRSSTAAASSPP